jgi:hypothetical protein
LQGLERGRVGGDHSLILIGDRRKISYAAAGARQILRGEEGLYIAVPALLVDGADAPPEQALDLVKVCLSQPDLFLGGPQPIRADSELDLEPLQFPAPLLELSIDPIQLLEQRLLFSRYLLRLLALSVQFPLELVELLALVPEARRGPRPFFGSQAHLQAEEQGRRKGQHRRHSEERPSHHLFD